MFQFLKKLFSGSSPESEGPVTAKQVALVQESWAAVVPISETAAELFYGRLFEIAPEVRPLFPDDLTAQGKKLMDMINTAVNGLTNLSAIVPAVQALGERHVAYGVKDEHYDTVAAALLWTLEKGLGDKFTPEVKGAWVAVYTVLATTMKEAAAKVPPPAEEPPVTAKQVELVQATWAKCVPIAETAADLFYGKLFELDPELKPLFKTDIKEQGAKLMQMINTAVNGLTNLEAIVPAVQDLGKRHVDYGVKASHYGTVAEALLWTLGQGLGDDFTDEVKEAWTAVYGVLAKVMLEAAESA